MAGGRRKAKTSADSQRHFARRLFQRYGLTITNEEYRALCQAVRDGNGRHLFKESNSRSHWNIAVQGTTVRVVYDKTTNALATALPLLFETEAA